MSSVRITVDGDWQGDVSVTVSSPTTSYSIDIERDTIDRLLDEACQKIRAAYGIGHAG